MIKNKGFIILLIINLVLFSLDLISTLRIGNIAGLLEANPLFKHIGFGGLVIVNGIIFLAYAIWYFKTKNPHSRFVILFALVILATTRAVIIPQNNEIADEINALEPQQAIEYAAAVTSDQKQQVVTHLLALNFLPIVSGLFTYLFFSLDHDIKRKGDVI